MSKYIVQCGWEQVPHLTKEMIANMEASLPPHQRDARMKGIPALGSGAIYPVAESEFLISPIELPLHWRRGYALDVGWNRTGVLFFAHDDDTDTTYLYSEHYRGQAEPSVHAEAIKARGEWLRGVIDPASHGRGQKDGEQLFDLYQQLGLHITNAKNGVESGIYEVYQRLSTGRIKVFSTLVNFLNEYRLYRRDEKGKIIKENDHLMDCLSGNTEVVTNNGILKIKDMIGTSGFVLGIDGSWKSYYDCGLRRLNSPVVQLTFSNGAAIVCTEDHLFLTKSGWKKAVCLTDCYSYDIDKLCQSSSKYRLKDRNTKAKYIGFVENIIKDMASAFIDKFGWTRKIKKYLKTIISIIRMRTAQTMSLKTWFASVMQNICPVIIQDITENYPHLLYLEPLNGTKVMRERHGIDSMVKIIGKNLIRGDFLVVRNAVNHMKLVLLGRCSVIKIVKCEHIQPENVYCMQVPDGHAFVLGNGLISHNCMRYAIASGIEIAQMPPAWKEAITGKKGKFTFDYDPLSDKHISGG